MNQASPLRASAWMLGAIASFTSMAVAGRAVSSNLDTFEIMMFRSLIGVLIVVGLATITGRLGDIKRDRLGIHALRNLSHFAGQNLWFFAITAAPLAQVFALEFSSPIWAMFLAVVVLGERLTPLRVATAFSGFFGILLVAQPWQAAIGPGIATAALAAIGFAGSAIFTRLLTRTERITSIMFWLTLMQLFFGLICAGYDGDIALPSSDNLPWVVLIALAGLVAHFCLTTALSLAPAAVVLPVDFARLPIIAMVGFLFYSEPFSIWVLAGAAVIFASNYANIAVEHRRQIAN